MTAGPAFTHQTVYRRPVAGVSMVIESSISFHPRKSEIVTGREAKSWREWLSTGFVVSVVEMKMIPV